MNNKKIDIIIIIIFLMFIYLPFLMSKIITVDNKNLENRVLAPKPEINLKDIDSITSFPNKFNDYWNDNLPFRNNIRQINSDIDYILFNSSSSTDVLLGKKDSDGNRWLFYNQLSEENPLGDITGTKKVTEKEINNIYKKICSNKELLGDKELYYVVIPNKSTIYSKYLPNNVNIVDNTMSYNINLKLQKLGVNSSYLYNELMEKSKDRETYYHLDSHWNNYGAFIASNYVLKMIDNDFSRYDDYKVEHKDLDNYLGDLYKVINTNIKMKDFEESVLIDYDNEVVTKKLGENMNRIVITENDNPYINKRVLILSDSYRYEMIPFLSHAFSSTISMHRDLYQYSMLEEYNPDIVLIIGVERYSKSIYNFDLKRINNIIE